MGCSTRSTAALARRIWRSTTPSTCSGRRVTRTSRSALQTDLIGRNVVEGRWTFQVVEEYDAGYYATFQEHERSAREALAPGRTHLFEAEMKEDRRTHGRRHHEATPD